MEGKYAKKFWTRCLELIKRNDSHVNMKNPGREFAKLDKMGVYDHLSEEDYFHYRQWIEEMAIFWKSKPQEEAGQIFLEALFQTPLSDQEMKEIISILVEASDRVDYCVIDLEKSRQEECPEDLDVDDL